MRGPLRGGDSITELATFRTRFLIVPRGIQLRPDCIFVFAEVCRILINWRARLAHFGSAANLTGVIWTVRSVRPKCSARAFQLSRRSSGFDREPSVPNAMSPE